MSQLLLSKTGNIEQYNELLDTVSRNAKRLNLISQRLKTSHYNCILNDSINVLDDIVLTTQYNGIKVQILYQPQDIFLEADKERIIQVISNWIKNAFKFTKTEGGTISVNVEKEKTEIADYGEGDNRQEVAISVKDTGTGIDPEILSRLFTRFATKSDTGTGLGLFISRRIVEAHGGKIWGENNSPEKGATFTFSQPLSKEKQSQTTKTCELIQCC